MRYFIDTEFIERGHGHPIELISLGIVAEDGREAYYVLSDGWDEAHCDDWLRANVLPHLGSGERFSRAYVARELIKFCKRDKPEFWAYYADCDWVVFCQLFGKMIDLPSGWPMYCRDVKQLAVSMGDPRLPKQVGAEHNALSDARHVQQMYNFLMA